MWGSGRVRELHLVTKRISGRAGNQFWLPDSQPPALSTALQIHLLHQIWGAYKVIIRCSLCRDCGQRKKAPYPTSIISGDASKSQLLVAECSLRLSLYISLEEAHAFSAHEEAVSSFFCAVCFHSLKLFLFEQWLSPWAMNELKMNTTSLEQLGWSTSSREEVFLNFANLLL